MKAYQSGIITKDEFIKELKIHHDQDNFIQGEWFENGKGGSLGCSLEIISRLKGVEAKKHDDYALYEKYLAIPQWLVMIKEVVFENLSSDVAGQWVLDFAQTIKEGQDLDKIQTPLKISIQKDNFERIKEVITLQEETLSQAVRAVNKAISTLESNDKILMDSVAKEIEIISKEITGPSVEEAIALEIVRSAKWALTLNIPQATSKSIECAARSMSLLSWFKLQSNIDALLARTWPQTRSYSWAEISQKILNSLKEA